MDRRRFLQTAGTGAAGLAALMVPGLSLAHVPTEQRLVLVLLRGGMDGLHALVPYADRNYRRLRPTLALGDPGADQGVLDLDGRFGLHPALQPLQTLFHQQQLLLAPATATVYRKRSHFDAQNLLEAGSREPFGLRSGWLNRALAELGGNRRFGLALGPTVPLLLQGDVPVASWADSPLPEAGEEFLARLGPTYAHDPLFAAALADADNSMVTERSRQRGAGRSQVLQQSAMVAADLLAQATGPRVAVIESRGWDTHFGQRRRLQEQFTQLVRALASLRLGLAPVWTQTVVLVVSEFGRTAAENGSNGTDHGVGGLAMLLGGSVAGGRLLGLWPGLAQRELYEGRDLRPTVAMESLFKGLLHEHLGIEKRALDERVFPNSQSLRAATGLIQSKALACIGAA